MVLGRKTVLVVCGLGVATSTVVAFTLEEEMKKRGIIIHTIQCKAAEVFMYVANADLIVSTTPIAAKQPVPIINALGLITGIGKEAIIEDVAEKLIANK